MIEWLLLIVAAFAAGILNSIAGGGSFLTLPALIFTGISPVAANATSAVAVFPGYLGAAVGFRREILLFPRKTLYRYLLIAVLGGLIGSLLLLVTSNSFFSLLIPWLLLFATVLFAFGEQVTKWLKTSSHPIQLNEVIILFFVSVYGGYFNGGLGIILLAVFILIGMSDLNQMNGLKNAISLLLSAVSVTTFAVAGIVHWPEAIVMMLASTAGGYSGALVARVLSAKVLRHIIIAIGILMALVFFFRI
ncbi:MAG: sulfite exporter TauE/SafE family protein [Bacteroidetes bacterium]|nr:sulfite exporter TauE/SafE family protein [Bacteroidota bacterium]